MSQGCFRSNYCPFDSRRAATLPCNLNVPACCRICLLNSALHAAPEPPAHLPCMLYAIMGELAPEPSVTHATIRNCPQAAWAPDRCKLPYLPNLPASIIPLAVPVTSRV